MRFAPLLVLAVTLTTATLTAAAPAAAQELQNDSFTPGMSVGYLGGFVTGEIAAARFVPSGPAQLTTIHFLFGGAPGMRTVRVHVWDDAAGTDAPGAELFAGDYSITASDSALSEINGLTVSVTGPFRVGLEFTADALPCVARDGDGTIDASANFVNAMGVGWTKASDLHIPGDFVLRAFVMVSATDGGVDGSTTDGGGGTDAGSTDAGSTDASTPHDAGTTADGGASADAGTTPGGGGCCGVAGASAGSGGSAAVALLLVALVVARRRSTARR